MIEAVSVHIPVASWWVMADPWKASPRKRGGKKKHEPTIIPSITFHHQQPTIFYDLQVTYIWYQLISYDYIILYPHEISIKSHEKQTINSHEIQLDHIRLYTSNSILKNLLNIFRGSSPIIFSAFRPKGRWLGSGASKHLAANAKRRAGSGRWNQRQSYSGRWYTMVINGD